ncbi:hypothetical protein B0H65DRAFT_304127 [Neurospora tetraspora]|uniref:Glycosyltransferase 2-like domain-containing protein n=1 Tax=Neurospora tetraspora TaxID=94610 RepID=A0AAE0J9U7_9PEZI|nr:hypothetical protein B0H65DRAFT_304127 [Neurospora tetraspora]
MQLVWKDGNEVDDEEESAPPMVERIVEVDAESGEPKREKRPVHLLNTYLVSITLLIVTVSLRSAWRQLAIEVMVDGDFVRLALVVLAQVQIFFTLFFAQVIIGCLAQIFGPIQQLSVNSKFYSAKLPPRLQTPTLPHVTVQCPVYKEGLAGVIAPTAKSIKHAISTYELQGGATNMFINDDGLQLISEEDRQERIEFYADHSIGWVARPRHGENGFQRRGKFKKAPNVNLTLMISCKVEEKLSQIQRSPEWSEFSTRSPTSQQSTRLKNATTTSMTRSCSPLLRHWKSGGQSSRAPSNLSTSSQITRICRPSQPTSSSSSAICGGPSSCPGSTS